ncbi:MAG: hypothetical protein ABH879_08600, partial [archaeon]
GYHQHHPLVYSGHEGMNKAIKYNARLFYKKFLNRIIYDMYHSFMSYDTEHITIEKSIVRGILWRHIGRAPEKQPSLDEIRLGIKLAEGEGIKKLILTGGDPLQREDLFDLLKLAAKFKVVGIDAPAESLLGADITKLTKAGVNKFVTYLVPCEYEHNLLSGGDYKRAVRGIKKLLDSDLDVKVNLIITKNNYIYARDAVRLMVKYGVRQLGIILPLSFGSNDRLFDEVSFPLSSVIYDYVLEALKLAKSKKIIITTENVYSDYVALFSILSKRMYDLFEKDLAVSRGPLR